MSEKSGERVVANLFWPLMRFESLRSFICRYVSGLSGSPLLGSRCLFPCFSKQLPYRPSLDAKTSSSFFLVKLSTSEFLRFLGRWPLSKSAPPTLVFALARRHLTSSTLQDSQYLLVLSTGDHNLTTVYSEIRLVDLFRSTAEFRTLRRTGD
jgi:hypothetical protein